LIEEGEIRTNFHNAVMLLAVELGLVVALLAAGYLLFLVVSWAFQSPSARRAGLEASRAAATLAMVLVVISITSSGVLMSPLFWTMVAVTALIVSPSVDDEGNRQASVVSLDADITCRRSLRESGRANGGGGPGEGGATESASVETDRSSAVPTNSVALPLRGAPN
jgi:hypothetical protein